MELHFALSSGAGCVQADLCHVAVLDAGSNFEAKSPGSCFPKEKEIVCVYVYM